MKRFMMICMAALSVWSARAQKEQTLAPFKKVVIEMPLRLTLVPSGESKITHPETLKGLETNVSNGILTIAAGDGLFPRMNDLQLYCGDLEQIDIGSSAVIHMVEGKSLESKELRILISDAAKAELKLNVAKLTVETKDAGKLTLSGTAKEVKATVNDVSHYQAGDLQTDNTLLSADGMGRFKVNAKQSLNIDAKDASIGDYCGSPKEVRISVADLARVRDQKSGEGLSSVTAPMNGKDDTTRITLGKTKVIIIDPDKHKGKDSTYKYEMEAEEDKEETSGTSRLKMKKVYSGLEFGVNTLTQSGLNFAVPAGYDYLECNVGKSWFVGVNILERDVHIIKNKLALTSGLGLTIADYAFISNRVLTPNVKTISADSGKIALNWNYLENLNITVPVLLKFAPRVAGKKNGFHFAVGVIGSYSPRSQQIVRTSANGYRETRTVVDDFNVNPFQLTGTVRAGYGWLRTFVNVGLTPYFRTAGGNPEMQTFAAGITLFPF